MPLIGRLDNKVQKQNQPTSTPTRVTSVEELVAQTTGGMYQPAQRFGEAAAYKMIDRFDVSTNTKLKMRDSIGLRIADEGQDAVLASAENEMIRFKTYRDGIVNSYAKQGLEVPEEVSTRLDDIEGMTGRRIVYQMMRKDEAAQLSGVIDPISLVENEMNAKLDLEDLTRDVITKDLQLEYQKDFFETAKAGEDFRKARADADGKERENRVAEETGYLNNLYAGASERDVMQILQTRSYRRHGISDDTAGDWAREQIKTAQASRKIEAEIAAKNESTTSSRQRRLVQERNLQRDMILGQVPEQRLQALAEEAGANGGTFTLGGLQFTANEIVSGYNERLKNRDAIDEIDSERIAFMTTLQSDNAIMENYGLYSQFYTGTPQNAQTVKNEQMREKAYSEIDAVYPPGTPQNIRAKRLVTDTFAEQNKELAENSIALFEENASDEEIAVAREFISRGNISFSENSATLMAQNPYFGATISANSAYGPLGAALTEDIRAYGTGQKVDAVDQGYIDFTAGTGKKDKGKDKVDKDLFPRFLNEVIVNQDDGTSRKTPITRRDVYRRNYRGRVQGTAMFERYKLMLSNEDREFYNSIFIEGQTSTGQPVFTENGYVNKAYTTKDGEVNFNKIYHEIHRKAVARGADAAVPSKEVASFNYMLSQPMVPDVEGKDDFTASLEEVNYDLAADTILNRVKPKTREESLMSAIVTRTTNVAEKDIIKATTLPIALDVAEIISPRDLGGSAQKAFADYERMLKSAVSDADLSALDSTRVITPPMVRMREQDIVAGAKQSKKLGNVEQLILSADEWSPNDNFE